MRVERVLHLERRGGVALEPEDEEPEHAKPEERKEVDVVHAPLVNPAVLLVQPADHLLRNLAAVGLLGRHLRLLLRVGRHGWLAVARALGAGGGGGPALAGGARGVARGGAGRGKAQQASLKADRLERAGALTHMGRMPERTARGGLSRDRKE